jgi:hypothetical protein
MKNNVTKKNVIEALMTMNFVDDVQVGDVIVTPADIKDTLEKSLASLENKAVKARERAQAKKIEGDELRDKIESVLDDNYKTISDIIAAVGVEDLTPAKVSARLGQLVKIGRVEKEQVKLEDRRVMGYRIATASDVDAE